MIISALALNQFAQASPRGLIYHQYSTSFKLMIYRSLPIGKLFFTNYTLFYTSDKNPNKASSTPTRCILHSSGIFAHITNGKATRVAARLVVVILSIKLSPHLTM